MMADAVENHPGHTPRELAAMLSVPDQSRHIHVAPDEVARFIHERGLPAIGSDGEPRLRHEALGPFLSAYADALEVERKYYAVPEPLRLSSLPWARTLTRMYGDDLSWPASLAPSQGELMRSLVLNLEPKTIVEIGCFTGISSVWMGGALAQLRDERRGAPGGGVLHSVDLFSEIPPAAHVHYRYSSDPQSYAQAAAREAGIEEIVRFHKSDSHAFGRRAREIIGAPIDLLFIDGDHSVSGCFHDYFLFYPHVAVGGLIVLHDIYPATSGHQGPRYVLDGFVKDSPYFDLCEIQTEADRYGPGRYGMALVRKRGPRRGWTRAQRSRMLASAIRDLALATGRKAGQKIAERRGQAASDAMQKPDTRVSVRQRLDNIALIRSGG